MSGPLLLEASAPSLPARAVLSRPTSSRRQPSRDGLPAGSIRPRDQPRRPSAITCFCFAFSKTLSVPTEDNFPRPS
jgi:hypothetical protein